MKTSSQQALLSVRRPSRAFAAGVVLSVAAAALGWIPSASAQLLPNPNITKVLAYHVYAASFVCGTVSGVSKSQVNEGLGAPAPLPTPPSVPTSRSYQLGGYSTALEIFNPAQRTASNVTVFVTTDGVPGSQRVNSFGIDAFQGARIGCAEIIAAIGPFVSTAGLKSGTVYLRRTNDDLQVTATYSQSTIAGFREFRGGLGERAGGGAGGLGLGSSIDVEVVKPVRVQGAQILTTN